MQVLSQWKIPLVIKVYEITEHYKIRLYRTTCAISSDYYQINQNKIFSLCVISVNFQYSEVPTLTSLIKGHARLFFSRKKSSLPSDFHVQLNKYETAPNFIQFSQNLTSDCLLIQLNFPVFTQFLHDLIIKLFCFDLQNNFLIRSCKNCVKTGKFS